MLDSNQTNPRMGSHPTLRSTRLPWELFLGMIAGALLFVPFWPALEQTFRNDPNYSHGYLVPFLVGWLTVRAWNKAGPPIAGDRRFAMMVVVPGCCVACLVTVLPWPILQFVALALILRGIALAIGGRIWASHFTAPILFLLFMFPVPVTWTSYLSLWLQDVVSRLSTAILSQFVLCHRIGTTIRLIGLPTPLTIAEECSGMRQCIGFLAFAILWGLLMERPGRQRLALAVGVIPIAIVANVVRVLLMCYGGYHFGTSWMSGWMHYAPAIFTLPLGFGLLIGLDRLLRIWGRSPQEPSVETSNPFLASLDSMGVRLRAVVVVLWIAVLGQFALRQHLEAAGPQSFPAPKCSLADFPQQLPFGPTILWTGKDRPDLVGLRSRIPYGYDELLLRDYRLQGSPNEVQMYAVFSRSGEDRKHHPEICIREVMGAPEELSMRSRIALDTEGKRVVQRFTFRTGMAQRTTVYYWHYTFHAPTQGETAIQRLYQQLGQTAPSLTMQISTLASSPQELEQIERAFLPSVDRLLQINYLPTTAIMDSTRLPVALLRE